MTQQKPPISAQKPAPNSSREAFSAHETAASGSELERRLGDIEASTQAQLGNIEVLLRNMMFQSRAGPVAQEMASAMQGIQQIPGMVSRSRAPQPPVTTPRNAFEAGSGSDRDQSPQHSRVPFRPNKIGGTQPPPGQAPTEGAVRTNPRKFRPTSLDCDRSAGI